LHSRSRPKGRPIVLPIARAGVAWLIWPDAILFGCAALVYALDLLDVLHRAAGPRTASQAFLLAAIVWLLCGLGLGAGTLVGNSWHDTDVAFAGSCIAWAMHRRDFFYSVADKDMHRAVLERN